RTRRNPAFSARPRSWREWRAHPRRWRCGGAWGFNITGGVIRYRAPPRVSWFCPFFFLPLPFGLPSSAPEPFSMDGAPIRPNFKREQCMNKLDSDRAVAVDDHVWRDLAGLGVEALAIGLAFSLILALAVFVVAREAPAGNFAAASAAQISLASP